MHLLTTGLSKTSFQNVRFDKPTQTARTDRRTRQSRPAQQSTYQLLRHYPRFHLFLFLLWLSSQLPTRDLAFVLESHSNLRCLRPARIKRNTLDAHYRLNDPDALKASSTRLCTRSLTTAQVRNDEITRLEQPTNPYSGCNVGHG